MNKEKTLFWILLGTLILFAGFYVFFVRSTVNNVVIRQNLETEASALSLSIGKLEFEYISARNSVTLALAHEMGFIDSENKTFIARNYTSKVAYLTN